MQGLLRFEDQDSARGDQNIAMFYPTSTQMVMVDYLNKIPVISISKVHRITQCYLSFKK